MRPRPDWLLVVVIVTDLYLFVPVVSGIGCFVCTSVNHDKPECEDTFNYTKKFYNPDCWAPRKGRIGLFPSKVCIKMTATDDATGFSLTVRDCVVDIGATSSENEIGNQIQCGLMHEIEFNGIRMRGCIISCETDACNSASSLTKWISIWLHVAVGMFVIGVLNSV